MNAYLIAGKNKGKMITFIQVKLHSHLALEGLLASFLAFLAAAFHIGVVADPVVEDIRGLGDIQELQRDALTLQIMNDQKTIISLIQSLKVDIGQVKLENKNDYLEGRAPRMVAACSHLVVTWAMIVERPTARPVRATTCKLCSSNNDQHI